jgi:phosphoserine aminotransferase
MVGTIISNTDKTGAIPMSRPVNFSAGPSMIPVDVLESLAADMVDYKGTGLSLVEVSHRGPVYDEVHNQTISSH